MLKFAYRFFTIKRIIALACFLFFLSAANAQDRWILKSPDSNITLTVKNRSGEVYYTIDYDGKQIILPSKIGLITFLSNYSDNLRFENATRQAVKDHYTLVSGKRLKNVSIGKTLVLKFETANKAVFCLEFRAYNDGVAFRYLLPRPTVADTILKESTEFHVFNEGQAWLQNYDLPGNYTPAYEGAYSNGIPVGVSAKDYSGWAFPALFHVNSCWLLLTEAGLADNYWASHLQQSCTGGRYLIASPLKDEAKGFGKVTVCYNRAITSPWRALMIGRSPGTIIESNLVSTLSAPIRLKNPNWVRPGKVSWSWWSDHSSSKDPIKLKKFIDLACRMHWDYSLIDANWNLIGGRKFKELIEYAKSKHVGLILWYNSGGPNNTVGEQPRNRMFDPIKRREEMSKLRAWGIKGIKVDFFQSDKPEMMRLYRDILKDAAAAHLFVDFHGCTLPKGWSRTYPNLLSMEAVKGAENYGWSKPFADNAPQHNTILAFTRNVVGPMDYTPVIFSDYACCPHVTTNTHELALSVVFESGLLHFADKASSYDSLSNPVKEFLRTVPVKWEETKYIAGEPGKLILLARRSGRNWFIAGINGEPESKQMTIDLSFLGKKRYKSTIYSDGSTPRTIEVTQPSVLLSVIKNIQIAGNGGILIKLDPIK